MKGSRTNKTNRRLLALVLTLALVFSNAGVVLTAEGADYAQSKNSAVVPANTNTKDTASITANVLKAAAKAKSFDGVVPDVEPPTSYTEVYERMIAWQEILPTGMAWNDDLPYGSQGSLGAGYYWKGGNIDGKRPVHVGCAALAAILSDVAFGNLPARKINRGSFTFENVRVGDILRVNNNSHSVIVLQKTDAGVVIAEGNNSGKVYWGRTMSKQDVMYADFILTRYPENFVSADEEGANEIVDQGTEGKLSWTLTKTGRLTISGMGAIPDFSPNDDIMPSWSKTEHPISSVVIESGITSIGNYAFYQSQAMSVEIPEGITKIGDSAFYGAKIIEANIPGTVKTIGEQGFRQCANLATLTLEEGVETIGNRAFQDCTEMAYILNIPSTVTYVGESAFQSCGELMSVQFADSNKAVVIKDYAFCRCWKMMSIKLPEELKTIANGLFYGCTMLTYVRIPATVTEISTVNGDVTKVSPFGSTALMQIDFEGDETKWNAIGGQLALRDGQLLGKVTVNCNVPKPTPEPEPTPEPTVTAVPTPEPTVTAVPTVTPTPTDNFISPGCKYLFYDYKYTEPVVSKPVIIYGNGGTFKTGTVKTTNTQFIAYTDILGSYQYTLNNKGIVKPATGKVIVGITKSSTKPSVVKNKIIDKEAEKIARAKIKNGQLTVTATGKEKGLVYLWIIDTGDKGVSECCPINVLLAPKKLEIQDTSGSKLKNPELQNGKTLDVCVVGIASENKKTDDCTYTVSVDANSQSYISVSPSGSSGNQFTITAKGLKSNKKTKAVVVFQCNENGKKIKFSLTITP